MNLSLLTGLPFFPPAVRGISVHISFTFSNTILQCRSKAFTLARSLRLLRQEINTCVCDRTAVCKIESGPDVNSCSSSNETSYSLEVSQYQTNLSQAREESVTPTVQVQRSGNDVREVRSCLAQKISILLLASTHLSDVR